MSSNLYNEAIVDAKQLIQMAEENAKNKLIDAVAPMIRKLVESQLLGEAEGDEDFDMLVRGTEDESEPAPGPSAAPSAPSAFPSPCTIARHRPAVLRRQRRTSSSCRCFRS